MNSRIAYIIISSHFEATYVVSYFKEDSRIGYVNYKTFNAFRKKDRFYFDSEEEAKNVLSRFEVSWLFFRGVPSIKKLLVV